MQQVGAVKITVHTSTSLLVANDGCNCVIPKRVDGTVYKQQCRDTYSKGSSTVHTDTQDTLHPHQRDVVPPLGLWRGGGLPARPARIRPAEEHGVAVPVVQVRVQYHVVLTGC